MWSMPRSTAGVPLGPPSAVPSSASLSLRLDYWRRATSREHCTGPDGVILLRRIRVVLTDMPHLLDEIVRTILVADPDVELDPQSVPANQIASADSVGLADVLIVAEQHPATDDYAPALYAHPDLRLVAISDDRKQAVLYELRPHRTPLGELSARSLVRAVHGDATLHRGLS